MKIIHNGETLDDRVHRHLLDFIGDYPEVQEIVREGVITADDGTVLVGLALQRLRDRLLGTYDHHLPHPYPGRRPGRRGPRRFLVPGLMGWGTIPTLGGNYKSGKSTVVCDFTRALVVPGYRFLDHFEPIEVTDDERTQGVVVINAETPWEDFEAALDNGMTDEAWDLLTIHHLEEEGGAQLMDLTDPAIYDLWVNRLAYCDACDGTDDVMPLMVIVDGVTAIGLAIGKDPEDYFGKWYAAFRRLLHECDIPNGLATGHNTMSGGHLMGGTGASAGPDGLWSYSSDRIDDPTSPRRFAVQPRMGGVVVPSTRVVVNDGGRPVVHRKPGNDVHPAEVVAKEPDHIEVIARRMADYVHEHPGANGQELVDNVEHGGWKENALAGRAKAVTLGLVTEEQCTSPCSICSAAGARTHHRRTHYMPVTSTV